jgi:hypothetical protein
MEREKDERAVESEYSCRGGHGDVYRWFTGHDPKVDSARARLGLVGAQGDEFERALDTKR